MTNYHNNRLTKMIFIVIFSAAVILIGMLGCASNLPISQKPGAMLWGENCGRCHNVRPPASYTDEQWETAVMHMRTRANLTADEAEKITAFLKAGN